MKFSPERVRALCGEFPNCGFDWSEVEYFILEDGVFQPYNGLDEILPAPSPLRIVAKDQYVKVYYDRVRVDLKPAHDIIKVTLVNADAFSEHTFGSETELQQFLDGAKAIASVLNAVVLGGDGAPSLVTTSVSARLRDRSPRKSVESGKLTTG